MPEPSFELSLLEASEGRLAGPASDMEAEYDAGASEPPEARSLTEVALNKYNMIQHRSCFINICLCRI